MDVKKWICMKKYNASIAYRHVWFSRGSDRVWHSVSGIECLAPRLDVHILFCSIILSVFRSWCFSLSQITERVYISNFCLFPHPNPRVTSSFTKNSGIIRNKYICIRRKSFLANFMLFLAQNALFFRRKLHISLDADRVRKFAQSGHPDYVPVHLHKLALSRTLHHLTITGRTNSDCLVPD